MNYQTLGHLTVV